MKNFFSKTVVAFLTFFLGIIITSAFFIFPKPADKELVEPTLVVSQQLVKATPTPSNEKSRPQLKSLSPYEIESFINSNPKTEIVEIWEKLKIADKYNGNSHYNSENGFFGGCSGCEAETYNFELDGQPSTEVLLRVEDRMQEACRYLIFKYKNSEAEENNWQLLGHIDHDFGRYQMPQHYFLLSGGKSWLMVRVQGASGSGVALYSDRLFTIKNNKVVEVLSYPADGHQEGIGFEPSRSFAGRIIEGKIENNVATVEVEFTVDYSTFDGTDNDIPLWRKKQRAIFRTDLNLNKTKLDVRHSNLSEREIEAVFNIDSLTDKYLLKYNFEELKKIALGKQSRQKQWLRDFLRICKPSAEKSALQRLISK